MKFHLRLPEIPAAVGSACGLRGGPPARFEACLKPTQLTPFLSSSGYDCFSHDIGVNHRCNVTQRLVNDLLNVGVRVLNLVFQCSGHSDPV